MQLQTVGSYRYVVLRYVYDARRELSVPAGVIVWGGPEGEVTFRTLANEERIPELKGHDAGFFLDDTVRRIRHWLDEKQLPFAETQPSPLSDDWWLLAKRILHHRVQLSPPMPLECLDPEKETDLLFDAVVAPRQPARRARDKMASRLDECLGAHLRRYFKRRPTAGYSKRSTIVTRLYETPRTRLVVEGINLARPKEAERDTYCLVGKAHWIRDDEKDAVFIVGYVASPGGLNGEGVYKSWIEKQLDTTCYDLVHEDDAFREAVRRVLDQESPQRPLDH